MLSTNAGIIGLSKNLWFGRDFNPGCWWKKEVLLVSSSFSFSHNVWKKKNPESCATTVLSTSNDFKIFWCGKEWVVIGFQLVNLYNGDLSVEREIRQEF